MMPKIERIKKRHFLKKRDQRIELDRIEEILGSNVSKLDDVRIESGELDDGTKILLLDSEIIFFETNGRLFPSLHALLKGIIQIPAVAVDMGAIRFVINGADIMRPGITKIDDGISEGSVVAIVDETHGKPLAVGISTMSSEDLRAASKGKVIQSVHYVNDHLWDFSKLQ